MPCNLESNVGENKDGGYSVRIYKTQAKSQLLIVSSTFPNWDIQSTIVQEAIDRIHTLAKTSM